MQLCPCTQATHRVLMYWITDTGHQKLMRISATMHLQEDKLAALQKSLEALCGPVPAQPSKPLQATPGRLAIPEQPSGTCLSAGAATDRNRQRDKNMECQPAPVRAGAPATTAQAPRMPALATLQQPRPTMSLLNSSGAPDSANRGRQLRLPLSRVAQHRPTGIESSNELPHPTALGTMRGTGASHSRPQQDSWAGPVFSDPSARLQQRQPAKGQEALMDSLKNARSPVWTDSRAQAGVHKPAEHLGQSLMQGPAGTAGRRAGRADAVGIIRSSAPAASKQQNPVFRQPNEPDHPAIPPLLEPAPYIVEEPDSPAQEPGARSWSAAAKEQKAMPSCLITETTITRFDMRRPS